MRTTRQTLPHDDSIELRPCPFTRFRFRSGVCHEKYAHQSLKEELMFSAFIDFLKISAR